MAPSVDQWSIWQLILIAVISLLVIRWIYRTLWQIKHFPPGPWGLPILGYLPWIDVKAHVSFDKLKEKYGSIYSIKLGAKTVVILADWASVKATLVDQNQIFSGRPPSRTFDVATQRSTVSFSDGEVWKNQRRLTVKCLRNVGMGRKTMEDMVIDSVHDIMEFLKSQDNKVICMNSVFFKPLLNNVWKLTASHEVAGSKDDDQFEDAVNKIICSIRNNNPVNFFSWLRFAPPNGFGYWEFIRDNKRLWGYLKKEIDKHIQNWKAGNEQDFIDEYISAIKKHESQPNAKPEGHLTYKRLNATLWDLFVAGVDTTNATTLWGMLYLIVFPEVQKKVQEELDREIGRERLPSLDDMPRLPYLDAFIMETHRYASISRLSLAHCPTKTTKVLGYTIPKGTPCFQCIYGVHRDPKIWKDPFAFRPERFIDENNEAKWPQYLMPYSIGPRACIGEQVAQMELQLIFGCLLHTFNFSAPPGKPTPTLEPEIALVQRPRPYSLLIQIRKD
ncbi:cytochrome P450 3201B1 [Chamberlinius hualienensis]|uniref:Cytochrome P450 3201B1 n=1 Tax=Chamberlinius hualienensis TaxID=1551368 RepID=A0A1J1DVP9_9MYRI|nr:cytochrome P450 3201B1 [Chamberlinius hualienensis]